jgi:type III secretory pathway component EscT
MLFLNHEQISTPMKRNLAFLLMLIMAVQAFPQEKKPLTDN